MSQIGANIWTERARMVAGAKKSTSFVDLVKISGLDKSVDFRFANWSGVDFSGCNLDGFDFTGARLHGCKFKGARISRARFDQAEIGAVLHDGKAKPRNPARQTKFANLRDATDWAACFDPKRWRKLSEPLSADHLPIGAVFQDAPFAPELVIVPSGKFLMGSPDGARIGQRASITFERPFAIGRFAVKAYEFIAFEESNRHKVRTPPSGRFDPLRLDESGPIINITWDEAVAYCDWLNEKVGLPPGTYRLPSEAEWEYAARAGTDGPFWWEGPISRDKANYDGRLAFAAIGQGNFFKGVMPVDRFDPNPWGLYQVHGNIWEWCQDAYVKALTGIPLDGTARERDYASRSDFRVTRGGAWHNASRVLHVHYRGCQSQDDHQRDCGFRIARTLIV
jgi:formylglycine-generating enzyme required for sulfatase activity